jgi:hypothetical protein
MQPAPGDADMDTARACAHAARQDGIANCRRRRAVNRSLSGLMLGCLSLLLAGCGSTPAAPDPGWLQSPQAQGLLTPPHPTAISAEAVRWALETHQGAIVVIGVCLGEDGSITLVPSVCR